MGSSGQYNSLTIRGLEYTGTASDPILEVTYSAPSITTYTYDTSGQRLSLDNGTLATIYPSKTYNVDSTGKQIKHIFSNGVEIGVVDGSGGTAVARYMATDHLTGSNVVTNSIGTIDETLDYYPYGGIRIDSGSYSDQRKYAGHEYDASTGLNYMNARYYDSSFGRFISQDPAFWNGEHMQTQLVDPQSWNSYAYARNNPLVYKDPTGETIDTAVDLGLFGFDLHQTLYNGTQALGGYATAGAAKVLGNEQTEAVGRQQAATAVESLKGNVSNLALDAAGTAIPFVPIASLKTAKVASKSFDAAKQQQKMLEGIENSKAINTIKDVFRKSDEVPGGTMGAIRNELLTGNPTKGIFHGNKAENTINRIQNIFKTEKLNSTETNRLQGISNSLKSLIKNLNR